MPTTRQQALETLRIFVKANPGTIENLLLDVFEGEEYKRGYIKSLASDLGALFQILAHKEASEIGYVFLGPLPYANALSSLRDIVEFLDKLQQPKNIAPLHLHFLKTGATEDQRFYEDIKRTYTTAKVYDK